MADFSDLGGVQVSSGPDFSDLGGVRVEKGAPKPSVYDKVRKRIAPVVEGGKTVLEKWRKLESMSKHGLHSLSDMIPDPQTTSVAANVVLGVPETVGHTLAEFAPSFISPEAAVFAGAGKVISKAASTTAGRKAAELAGRLTDKYTPTFKRALTYRFGQPKAYQAAAEQAGVNARIAGEDAVEIGRALQSGLSKSEQMRLGQIIRGSISASERELPLRLRSSYARGTIDALEKEAKGLGLIPQNALNRYTKKELAALRKQKVNVDRQIEKLRNFGGASKEKLLQKADNLNVSGLVGVVRQTEKAEGAVQKISQLLDDAKATLTGEEFAGLENIMSHETLRRSKAVQKLLGKFEKASIGDKEVMFNRLSKVAERAGLEVGKIYEKGVSISGYKGLLNQINSLSSRFPGKAKMIAALESRSLDLQKKIADSYITSGQKYMPRTYLPQEAPKEATALGYIANRIKGNRFLKRNMDLSEVARKEMGEIRQPAYPVAKGIAEVAQDVERFKLFKEVASNPNWVAKDASAAAAKNFKPLSNSPSLGPLAGKMVHPEIARDLTEMTRAKSAAEKAFAEFNSKWKFGKVVLNPATHFRNMVSNSIFMDLSGISHAEQPKLLARAAREISDRGPLFQEARKAGLIGGDFIGGEIKLFRDALMAEGFNPNFMSRAIGVAKRLGNQAGKIYQAEEQVFKLAKFIKNRRAGMSAKAAVADAEKWLFNYEKVSPAVKKVRNAALGAPFITFSAKAVPRLAETAIKNPMRLYKYKAFFDTYEGIAKRELGLTDEQVETIKRNTRGQSLILPIKDKTGAPYVLDLSYMLPWGDIGESGGMNVAGVPLPSAVSFGGPLKAGLDTMYNKSPFKEATNPTGDSRIFNPATDFGTEKAAKVSDYFLKSLLPSLTPGVNTRKSAFKGGHSFQKIDAAIRKKPDYFGRVRPIEAVLADTILGLKATPISPEEIGAKEVKNKEKAMKELKGELRRVLVHPGISKKEKDETIEDFEKKVLRIWGVKKK